MHLQIPFKFSLWKWGRGHALKHGIKPQLLTWATPHQTQIRFVVILVMAVIYELCSCCTILFACFYLPAACFMNSSEWLLIKSALRRVWWPDACPFEYSDGSEGQPNPWMWLYALQKTLGQLVQRGKILHRLVQLPKYTSGTLNTVSVYWKIQGENRTG